VFLSFLLDDFLRGLIATKRAFYGSIRVGQPGSRDSVAWDAAPCRAEGEIAENVEWAWLFFAFLSTANILLSLPIQAPLSGHLMYCSWFIISLDISSQGVLHIGLSFQLIPESNEDLNARYRICSCCETHQLNHLGSQNGRN
jgi:hypothetical protein